jgi:hypothetical protein
MGKVGAVSVYGQCLELRLHDLEDRELSSEMPQVRMTNSKNQILDYTTFVASSTAIGNRRFWGIVLVIANPGWLPTVDCSLFGRISKHDTIIYH